HVCPALPARGGAVPEHRLVAGLLDDPLQQTGNGEAEAQLTKAGDELGEAGEGLERGRAQLGLLPDVQDGLEGRDLELARDPLQLGDAAIPDLAPGGVDDPSEG